MQLDQHNIQAPLLDRLIDEDPELKHEPAQQRMVNIRQFKAALIRDLENLLNTKRNIEFLPLALKQVHQSLFVYGLRDFTGQNPRSPSIKQQLRLDIERTIARFEPRLKNVTVQLETQAGNERNLRFRITGLLEVEPITEPVTFDTYFDVNRGEYIISK